jgi:hypothetical protein
VVVTPDLDEDAPELWDGKRGDVCGEDAVAGAFYSGQKVVLRRAALLWQSVRSRDIKIGPVPGKAYTVLTQWSDAGLSYVELYEMQSTAFDERLFAPLVQQKTDISIFKRIFGGKKSERR